MNNKHQTNKTIIKTKQCLTSFIPAAKWRGDDFLPAVSLALTLWWLTSFFTLFRSPFLQASNRSLPGSLAWEGDDESFWSNDRLVAIFIHLLTRNIGQTRDLKFKGKRLEDIDCLHRGWYQSTTCKVKFSVSFDVCSIVPFLNIHHLCFYCIIVFINAIECTIGINMHWSSCTTCMSRHISYVAITSAASNGTRLKRSRTRRSKVTISWCQRSNWNLPLLNRVIWNILIF